MPKTNLFHIYYPHELLYLKEIEICSIKNVIPTLIEFVINHILHTNGLAKQELKERKKERKKPTSTFSFMGEEEGF